MLSGTDRELLDRLHRLTTELSQADIARRSGVSANNISRYMRGGKMPLEFGVSLARGLGVSPGWLLTGEGAPFSEDLVVESKTTATDLLELVRAMAAVEKMKLGALAGKHHLKVLRELNDALVSYEELRERLGKQTRPVFERVLDAMHKANAERNFEQAEALQRAAEQVSRFCPDPDLMLRLARSRFELAFMRGLSGDALRHQREVFMRMVAAGGPVTAPAVEGCVELVMSLYQNGRIEEGLRYVEFGLVLAKSCPGTSALETRLRVLRATMLLESGDLARSLAEFHAVQAVLDDFFRTGAGPMYLRAMLLSGMQNYDQANAIEAQDRTKGLVLLGFAIWQEDETVLRRACRDWVDGKVAQLPKGLVPRHQAPLLLAALRGDAGALESFDSLGEFRWDRKTPSEAYPFVRAACLAQILRVLGKTADALKTTVEAESELLGVSSDYTLDVLPMAIHARNVLELTAAGVRGAAQRVMRERAQRFFDERLLRGFGCFRAFATRGLISSFE